MAGLARVDEQGGRSGRGQRRRDLASDVTLFAHAHHDHPAAAAEDQRHGLGEGPAGARLQAEQRLRLDVEGLMRQRQRAGSVECGLG